MHPAQVSTSSTLTQTPATEMLRLKRIGRIPKLTAKSRENTLLLLKLRSQPDGLLIQLMRLQVVIKLWVQFEFFPFNYFFSVI